MRQQPTQPRRTLFTRTEALLVAILAVVGLQTVGELGLAEPRTAEAQVGSMNRNGQEQIGASAGREVTESATFINPAKQRDEIIAELRLLNAVLQQVEAELADGLEVELPRELVDQLTQDADG